jgi:cyanate permease
MDLDIADGWVWALVIVGGPLLLGIFMWVFSSRRRRLTQNEQQISDEAAHENWGKERIR